MIELNENQIQRLCMVIDFEEGEEIANATIDCERGGWLEINCVNRKYNCNRLHKHYLAKHLQEDLDKVGSILNGAKWVG